ncbi:hypothetical protein ACFPM1_07635 [Halorubrum rubrum]|uniref:Small CPxCG-related zinc finger protein n=1 Tax=Halorubrum rubrum TaxID=1126240 RepID=A0ABD5R0Z0_9EURY|nr:hypothetical protein [Halorubrum rubrum]
MTEPCPNCETDLLVGGGQGPYYRWQCHGCGEQFGAVDTEPIAYDDVDEWYESASPDGVRLHTERGCIPVDRPVVTHTPEEAEDSRHGRCITCGHEVVES